MTKEKDKKPELEEIAENLFVIRLFTRLPSVKMPVNLYFFAGEDGLLWDAGYGDASSLRKVGGALEEIRQIMAERGQKCAVKKILISHAHMDHFAGLAGLREITGAKVLLTASQARKIGSHAAYRKDWHGKWREILPRPSFSYFAFDLFYFELEPWMYEGKWLPDPDEIIPESGMLRGGSRILRCFPIPGHSDDHLALYDAKEGLLFTGDHVQRWTTWLGPPLSDLEAYEKGLVRMMALNPLKKILPAHGPAVDDPLARLEKSLQHAKNRTAKVVEVLEMAGNDGLTYSEIVRRTYPGASLFHRLFAHGWVFLSLQKLLNQDYIGLQYKKGRQVFFRNV